MIRGVSKNVIEITDTGNECFERAILFVRPESAAKENGLIKRSAANYLSGIKLRPWFYPKGRLAFRILGFLLAASAGAGITALIFLF